jgi:hypothetical protein
VTQDMRALGVKIGGDRAPLKRALTEPSEEGQAPHRSVEPAMVMMSIITIH